MTLSTAIKLLIVEDQPAIRKDVEAMLKAEPDCIVAGTCGSVREALVLIPAVRPDLLLLDITLPDGTAFDILSQTDLNTTKIIFLTAHREHAIQAIKFGALDYLLKPLDQEELTAAIHKAKCAFPVQTDQVDIAQQAFLQTEKRERMVLRSQDYLQVVELREIVYCHSDAGYTTFHLADGRKMLTSKYLKEYEDLLPDDLFVRPHQSYFVNSRFIDRYRKNEGQLLLRDGTVIPVSTRRSDMIRAYMNNLH